MCFGAPLVPSKLLELSKQLLSKACQWIISERDFLVHPLYNFISSCPLDWRCSIYDEKDIQGGVRGLWETAGGWLHELVLWPVERVRCSGQDDFGSMDETAQEYAIAKSRNRHRSLRDRKRSSFRRPFTTNKKEYRALLLRLKLSLDLSHFFSSRFAWQTYGRIVLW